MTIWMTMMMIRMTSTARNPFQESAMRPRRMPATMSSFFASSLSLTFLTTLIMARVKNAKRNATKAYSVPLENTEETMGNAIRP